MAARLPVLPVAYFFRPGMIVAVGISSLQHVDMNSSRNLFIIGFSLFTGLALPQWISVNQSTINTGEQIIACLTNSLLCDVVLLLIDWRLLNLLLVEFCLLTVLRFQVNG
jgi:xanthine/uracil permease